jgi:uncharacterized membrane protein YsdA (DUF1294 family)
VLTVVLILIVGFAAYSYASQYHLPRYLVWLATVSVVTFIWYGFDKSQSKRGGLRVPEIILQLLAVAGGFPGGWLGMIVFRHKTKHGSFIIVLALSTLLHLGLAPTLMAL